MKPFRFIINSYIFISLGAVSLSLATQVQLGMQPHMNESIAIVFFITILNYNFHRLVGIRSIQGNSNSVKYLWAKSHKKSLIILMGVAIIGLSITLFRIQYKILLALLPLAGISGLYTFSFSGKRKLWLSKIPGLKTIMIAFVWASVTLFIPAFQSTEFLHHDQLLLLFIERFTFIFALAIPFDIRDMGTDVMGGIKTIPIVWGTKKAMLLCNSMMTLSALIASYQFYTNDLQIYIPAYLLTIGISAILINSKRLPLSAYYFTGLLDGCLLLNGTLICVTSLLFL